MLTTTECAELYVRDVYAALGFGRAGAPAVRSVADAAMGTNSLGYGPRSGPEAKVYPRANGHQVRVRVGTPLPRVHWLLAHRLAGWLLESDGVDVATVRALRAQVGSALLMPRSTVMGATAWSIAADVVTPVSAAALRVAEVAERPAAFVTSRYALIRGDSARALPRDATALGAWAAGDVAPLRFTRQRADGGVILAA